MNKKKLDFMVVILVMALAAWVSLVFKLKPLTGSMFYLVLPAVFLCLREQKNYKKLFWGTLCIGLMMGLIFDFLQTFNGGWDTISTVIPLKILGVPPIDNILGYGIMTFFTLVFYEHFLDNEKDRQLSKSLMELIILSIIGVVFVLGAYLIHSDIIKISTYAYFKGGLLAVIFPIYFCIRNPKLIPKLAIITVFSFFVYFVAELVVVRHSGWIYPGQYVGWVSFFNVTFPIEELLFWMLFYGAFIVTIYERFIDDHN